MMIIETRLYKTEKWFIVVLYKPPKVNDKSFELSFANLRNALQSQSSLWFVMGDTNFDMNSDNPLCDLCVMYSLSNLVNGPTCFKSDNPTAVDVLLSSEPKRFKCALNTSRSLSDFHNFTCVATKLHKCYTSPRTIFYRSYKKIDNENFVNDVKIFPSLYWISSMMKTTVYGVSVNCCPVSLTAMPQSKRKFLRNRQYLIWIAVSGKLFIRKTCYAMHIKMKKRDDYRKPINLTTAINKQYKLTYFRERCDGGPKNQSFWKIITPFMSDKSLTHGKQVILQEDDKIISDTNEICEIFNTYFTSVANNIGFDDNIPPDFYTEDGFSAMINKHCLHPSIVKIKESISSDIMLNFQCINGLDVAEIIKCFDGKKAQGYDMMHMRLFQKCAPYIAPEISKLVNNFIIKSVFPNDLNSRRCLLCLKRKMHWVK